MRSAARQCSIASSIRPAAASASPRFFCASSKLGSISAARRKCASASATLPRLEGQDALLSIVQMPAGVPVATVAIDNATNAGLLAAQILAVGDRELRRRLQAH